ncbi:MAG TPA: helix-turn-helix domain-containing protein [Pseudonocardia sp.]
MRVDAQRNRARILEAARALVAETGVDATMEDIARHAGVAVGTLYRHFPAKEDLVAAVVEDSLAQMASLTEGALAAVHAGAPPGVSLGELFREVAERYASDRAFKSAAGHLDVDVDSEIEAAAPGTAIARSALAISELLRRAQLAGEVRADLTLADLAVLLAAVPGAEVPRDSRARFVDIVIAGLAPALHP